MTSVNTIKLETTVLLATLVFSVFAPIMVEATETGMLGFAAIDNREDVFNGSFLAEEAIAAPNEKFGASFSIHPIKDLQKAIIHFTVPADLVKLIEGTKTWTGDVRKGETVTLPLSLATDGEVETYVRADVEAYSSGVQYHSSYYFHVVTPNATFDNRKGGLIRQANPACIGTSVNTESSRALLSTNVEPAAGTFRIYGELNFTNEAGGWSPARFMLVEIWDTDISGEDDQLASGWTDANGYFDITAPNNEPGGEDPYVRLIAQGEFDWVTKPLFGDAYWWRFPMSGTFQNNVPGGWAFNTGGLRVVTSAEALQAGDAVYQEAQWLRGRVSWSRPAVTIYYPFGDWPRSSGNSILLPDKSVKGWNHVTVHHEEAHCVMYNLYGHFPSGDGPDPHYVFNESSGGFAMCEGFAEFMQCAIDNNTNNLADYWNGHGGDIETNDWFNCTDTGDMDGGVVEGSVASILWDIFDPTNPGDRDFMFYDFDDMFRVLRYDQPDNIDQFWDDWVSRYPDMETNVGPLSSIYWHYGVDKDYYPPTGTISINAGATYASSRYVTLWLSGIDWGSGVSMMRFSEDEGVTWGPWYSYQNTQSFYISAPSDGLKWVDVQFVDNKGHLSAAGAIYDGITLDTTPPSGSIVINSGNPPYVKSTSVTLYLTCIDYTSGVDKVRYSNDGLWDTEPWEAPATAKAWTLATGSDGTRTVYYQIRDYAGLLSTVFTDTIILDTIAPLTIISHNSGSSTVSLLAGDATSGVKATYYRIDYGLWITYVGPFTLTGTGSHTIEYYSQDNAGNNEVAKQLMVHYLTVNTNPLAITPISGTGWYDQGTTAVPGKAPAIVVYNGTTYYFSTWKVDGSSVSGNPILLPMNAPHTATAFYDTTYSAKIRAHCNTEGFDVSVSIKKDGSPSGYNTPYTFSGLTGSHSFTVPNTDVNGHKFKGWSTGETTTTITVTAGGTYTAYYEAQPSFTIWTDKSTYRIGETMKVYVRVVNPGNALPVRAVIKLQLPNGNYYGPLLDMTVTLPTHYDSGTVLWNQFTLPTLPAGNYKWIAELRNPTTGTLISQNIWNWQLST